jgi:RoxA-like, cytochrome c-like
MLQRTSLGVLATTAAAVAVLLVTAAPVAAERETKHQLLTPDPRGMLGTVSTAGEIVDRTNPFFQSLGTNGRSCVTCHVPSAAWTITPSEVRERFARTDGRDPLFRTVDGSNSPNADVSSEQARRTAYNMLLNKGLIRVGIGIPDGAEFTLVQVDDPYAFASKSQLSLFRRPLPSTNLDFLSAVMWDGRETFQKLLPTNTADQNEAALRFNLAHQAVDATLGHAQAAAAPTQAQQNAIVDFELSLYTAQAMDNRAGALSRDGAHGGPWALQNQPFSIGSNELVVQPTQPPTVMPPEPAMTLFTAWSATTAGSRAQQSIARGEALFNSRTFTISGVAGLNDALGLSQFRGTCSTCHNDPNIGNHSTTVPLNIGIADASRRTPDMPLYTLRNDATGQIIQTTDPGRALITGKWADVGKFKGPVLRGLAARAPYFHNGSAATLQDVVDFYNTRFAIGLTNGERADLVAFLSSL